MILAPAEFFILPLLAYIASEFVPFNSIVLLFIKLTQAKVSVFSCAIKFTLLSLVLNVVSLIIDEFDKAIPLN